MANEENFGGLFHLLLRRPARVSDSGPIKTRESRPGLSPEDQEVMYGWNPPGDTPGKIRPP